MSKHHDLMAKWKKDEKFNAAYDALDDEFALSDEILAARKKFVEQPWMLHAVTCSVTL